MDAPARITLESSHTPEMVRRELSAIAEEEGPPRLTMRGFIRLCMEGSPFVEGGQPTYGDLSRAREILGAPDASPEEIAGAVCTALRPLECLGSRPEGSFSSQGDRGICPEWLCDIYAAVCRAAPATTWEAFMDRLPLVAVMHLLCAARRAQGGFTERPYDYASAIREIDGK